MQTIKIYSMRVAMLCRLYDLKLINDKEYTKIKNRLDNDYKKMDRKKLILWYNNTVERYKMGRR